MNINASEPSDLEIRKLFESQTKRHTEMTSAIAGENIGGYPTAGINIMEHAQLNRLAARNGMKDPDYERDPVNVYARAQREIGADSIDQWIPENPLSMSDRGFEGGSRTATTGAEKVVVDGMEINEPEDVIRKALKDSRKGKDISILGMTVKMQKFAARLLPVSFIMKVWLKIK